MPTAGSDSVFTERDLETLRARGLTERDALDQLERLRRGSGRTEVVRPATPGDGIERATGREPELDAHGRTVIAAGRCSAFIPASGAATRMFHDLIPTLEAGIADAASRRLLAELPHFAFHAALAAVLERQGRSLESLRAAGDAKPIVEALLASPGLGYAHAPKGLVLFHRHPEGSRTALAEHLADAAATMADGRGLCRLHFTVAIGHATEFAAFARAQAGEIGQRAAVSFELGFSSQSAASDCIAATPEGAPFRGDDGDLVFRPGGHGALLANLGACGGDLVFLRNVDNVSTRKHETHQWMPRILGRLAELERDAHERLRRLDDPSDGAAADEALRYAAETFRRMAPAAPGDPRARARALLDRPIRMCGMVPNTGEPGGGPFWVRGAHEVTLQIVERAQIAPEHGPVYETSTHFNPVFMACALRDRHGRPRDLAPFVDPHAVIVTRKSDFGRSLLALERPGLWNGAMAHWNTVFVEIPASTFTPVKTVFDLLRPEHQPAT